MSDFLRLLRRLVAETPLTLSSDQPIEWSMRGGEGDEMAVTVQTQFESVVTQMYEEAFVGSSIENGTTVIKFDLRQLDFQRECGITSTIYWRKDTYHVDVHELSTFHNPIRYRFIGAQGSYFDEDGQRIYFTPEIKGVSTSQHMSHSIIRLSCYLAVVCGVSLRQIALIFSFLFLISISKSSIKRWIDAIGSNLPSQEEMLQYLLVLKPVPECHLDGYYPMGTDNCVMVVKDEPDRILMTYETESENGDDARQFLKRLKARGLNVTSAFSDYSESFMGAIQAVFPHARFQADHFHTMKNIWKHLKKSLLSYRRQIKSRGEDQKDENLIQLAKTLWKMRWSLLKKPVHLSSEERKAIQELEKADAGFVQSFRSIIRQLVNLFDHCHSESQVKLRLKQLRMDIEVAEDKHLDKILQFLDDHWDQAFAYLRQRGMGKHRRGSNSESGMRLLRRLEKNHDGIRSATTRQHYIQIYQAIKYCSLDIAEFVDKGPRINEVQSV
jgi:hypothetical protein